MSCFLTNLSEGLHNDRCIDCKSYLNYLATKDEKLKFRCFECRKNYEKNFSKELIKNLQIHMNFAIETSIIFFCY